MYVNSIGTKLAIFFKTFQTDFYGVDTSWWFNCIHQLSRSFVRPLHCQHCKTRNWSPSAGECFPMWVLTTSACIRFQWPVWVTGESPYYRHHNTDTTHVQTRTGVAFLPQRFRAYEGQGDFLIESCLMDIIYASNNFMECIIKGHFHFKQSFSSKLDLSLTIKGCVCVSLCLSHYHFWFKISLASALILI